jgi:hypothetical protein
MLMGTGKHGSWPTQLAQKQPITTFYPTFSHIRIQSNTRPEIVRVQFRLDGVLVQTQYSIDAHFSYATLT